MIDIVILLLLVFGFIAGKRKGLVKQIIQFVSIFIAIFVAYAGSKSFATILAPIIPFPKINNETADLVIGMLSVQDWYYRVIAFIILFIATKLVLRFIGNLLDVVSNIPGINFVNKTFGGILGFAQTYLMIFVVVYIVHLLPISNVQSFVDQSLMANVMIHHTPVLSQALPRLTNEM